MSSVAEWILENKDKIEKGVEILGQGCEILAKTVGQFHPVLEMFFKISAEFLHNPEGKQATYLAQQFERVNQKLEKIQAESEKIKLALQRSLVNIQNFKFYTQIINQYEMFKYIFTAKPKFKELKIDEFLIYYDEYEGDKNLDCLYNAIIKENVLGTIVDSEQRSRRAVEESCACLKKVFVVGIIALMGYTALKEGTVGEDMVKKWQERMEDVEKRMKVAVDECVNNFAEQAEIDIDQKLKEKQSSVDPEFTEFLLDALVKKYDWVSWSVRVFKDDDDSKLGRFLFGKQQHVSGGNVNYFEHLCNNKIRVVVSFTTDPKPLNKSQIKDQIEEEKGDMKSVAESLCKSLPNCHVHAVSRKVEEANNFDPECYYYAVHKRAHICIHSE
ncbi:uncharacterized protein LOC113532734 [Pangasianodon hypophthalmus]|uniref:uncharacterized protein LOC113532734 n=1 Tax=Pangasianodon hypophthalmus TaxID=310915 RepID=UPI002307CBF8|nr:uncharacterized protein LOC113532734 [Pangasianodon hypophthalmus]